MVTTFRNFDCNTKLSLSTAKEVNREKYSRYGYSCQGWYLFKSYYQQKDDFLYRNISRTRFSGLVIGKEMITITKQIVGG